MESLSGVTAATMVPTGETATADEETAPVRGVGVGVAAGAGVGVGTTVGSEVGVGRDVAVGVDVADGPVHAANISPSVAKRGIAARPEGIRVISSSCRYPHRPG